MRCVILIGRQLLKLWIWIYFFAFIFLALIPLTTYIISFRDIFKYYITKDAISCTLEEN